MQHEDACNALLLPARVKRHKKPERKSSASTPHLSKSQQRKLRRLQEEKEKRQQQDEVLSTLQKHKLADDAYALLHSSSTRGQRENMREKLRRAMQFKRAGLKIPSGIPLFCERIVDDESYCEAHIGDEGHGPSKTSTQAESSNALQAIPSKLNGYSPSKTCTQAESGNALQATSHKLNGGYTNIKYAYKESCNVRKELLNKKPKMLCKEQEACKSGGQNSGQLSEHGHPLLSINDMIGASQDTKRASKRKRKRKARGESAMHDHTGSAMDIDGVSAARLSNSETRKESNSSPLTGIESANGLQATFDKRSILYNSDLMVQNVD